MKILLHPRALAGALSLFILWALGFLCWQSFSGPPSEEVAVPTSARAKSTGSHLETAEDPQMRPQSQSAAETDLSLAAKEAKLAEVLRHLRQYTGLWQKLAAAHPALENIHDSIRKWSRHGHSEQYAVQKKMLSDLSKDKPELSKVMFKIMYLQRPAVLLSMMDDPQSQAYMRDVLEIAGCNALVPRELALMDIYAGDPTAESRYPSEYPIPQTLEEYRAALEARTETYAQATQQLASSNGIGQAADPEVLDYMAAQMRGDIAVDYLKQYHDSFFTGEVEALAAKIQQLVKEYEALPANVNVTPAVQAEYLRLRGAQALSTLSDLPGARQANN